MKILFLTRRFWPDIGGVEKHVYEISKILIKKGHSVKVLTQSSGKEKEIDGIEIIRIDKIPKRESEKVFIWKWFWKNRELIKNSDVIHAHDVYFWYWPFRFIFLSKKSFITFHGYESYPISKKALIIRKISEIMANRNIIVGDFIAKWYYTNPDYVIYGGTDIPRIKNQESRIKNQESAVFIGRLDEHTGIMDYAKAVSLVRKSFPKFRFGIVGDGKYKNRLKKFRPIGFKANAETYMDDYNFAFVSRYLSILEALVRRKLVFAMYDNPVKEDYLKMSPLAKFIVVERSSEELAKKVIFYLKNPERTKALIDNGYKWAEKQSWENVVNTYLRLWKK